MATNLRRGHDLVAAGRLHRHRRFAFGADGGGPGLEQPIDPRPVWFYTYVFRGTPLYIQLLILYTGIYSLQWCASQPCSMHSSARDQLHAAGLRAQHLRLHHGGLAGAIRATPYGEIEAGRAYGMSKFTLYLRIILPSALRRSLPYYSNEVILMLHSTTLAFTATVPDLLKVARDVNSATYSSFEAFGIAAVLYALMVFALIWLFRRCEMRWLAYLKPQTH
jgi:histidine transport system permease protein